MAPPVGLEPKGVWYKNYIYLKILTIENTSIVIFLPKLKGDIVMTNYLGENRLKVIAKQYIDKQAETYNYLNSSFYYYKHRGWECLELYGTCNNNGFVIKVVANCKTCGTEIVLRDTHRNADDKIEKEVCKSAVYNDNFIYNFGDKDLICNISKKNELNVAEDYFKGIPFPNDKNFAGVQDYRVVKQSKNAILGCTANGHYATWKLDYDKRGVSFGHYFLDDKDSAYADYDEREDADEYYDTDDLYENEGLEM